MDVDDLLSAETDVSFDVDDVPSAETDVSFDVDDVLLVEMGVDPVVEVNVDVLSSDTDV